MKVKLMAFFCLSMALSCSKNKGGKYCYKCASLGYTNGSGNPNINFDTCSNERIPGSIPYTLPNGNDYVLTCTLKN